MPRAKKPSIRRLIRAAEDYERNLLNRNILLIGARDDGIRSVELRFLARHFKHLTGVVTNPSGMPSGQLLRMCLRHAISLDDLNYDVTGRAGQKLDAANAMFAPDLSAQLFGEANRARLQVTSDMYAGNTWAALGLIRDEVGFLDPVTLLRSPARDEVLPKDQYRVIAVLAKSTSEERYGEFRRVSEAGCDWDSIVRSLPDELSYLSQLPFGAEETDSAGR